MLCIRYQPGFALTSLVLPADIPACVPWRLFLLPLRHVHQVHLVKWFVTRLAPQLLIAPQLLSAVPPEYVANQNKSGIFREIEFAFSVNTSIL